MGKGSGRALEKLSLSGLVIPIDDKRVVNRRRLSWEPRRESIDIIVHISNNNAF